MKVVNGVYGKFEGFDRIKQAYYEYLLEEGVKIIERLKGTSKIEQSVQIEQSINLVDSQAFPLIDSESLSIINPQKIPMINSQPLQIVDSTLQIVDSIH
jgi:hypothetical protein